jgi:hypothetical protein
MVLRDVRIHAVEKALGEAAEDEPGYRGAEA